MRKNKVKNIVVFDLELNQPSDAIIELGYVIGNPLSDDILVKNSIVINPHEKLADMIVNLTSITQEMVDGGVSLTTAYEEMRRDVLEHRALQILHQWGVYDTPLLKKQLKDEAEWSFGGRFVDVKALGQAHCIIHGVNNRVGLMGMATRMGIDVDKTKQHRADYDALITFYLYGMLARHFLK